MLRSPPSSISSSGIPKGQLQLHLSSSNLYFTPSNQLSGHRWIYSILVCLQGTQGITFNLHIYPLRWFKPCLPYDSTTSDEQETLFPQCNTISHLVGPVLPRQSTTACVDRRGHITYYGHQHSSPFLYSFYTNDCISPSTVTIYYKYFDGIATLGLLTDNYYVIVYHHSISHFTQWWTVNFRELNVDKLSCLGWFPPPSATKQWNRSVTPGTSASLRTKKLHLTNTLLIYTNGPSRDSVICELSALSVSLPTSCYKSMIEAVLLYCSPCFNSMLSTTNRNKLTRITHTASQIIHSPCQTSVTWTTKPLYASRIQLPMTLIIPSTHISHCCLQAAGTELWNVEGLASAKALSPLPEQH